MKKTAYLVTVNTGVIAFKPGKALTTVGLIGEVSASPTAPVEYTN